MRSKRRKRLHTLKGREIELADHPKRVRGGTRLKARQQDMGYSRYTSCSVMSSSTAARHFCGRLRRSAGPRCTLCATQPDCAAGTAKGCPRSSPRSDETAETSTPHQTGGRGHGCQSSVSGRGLAGGERVLGRNRDRPAAVGVEERRGRLAAEGFDARDRGIVERGHLRLTR